MCAAVQAEKLIRKFNELTFYFSEIGIKDNYEQAMVIAIIKKNIRNKIDDVFNGE